jgi:hypothetical protein
MALNGRMGIRISAFVKGKSKTVLEICQQIIPQTNIVQIDLEAGDFLKHVASVFDRAKQT